MSALQAGILGIVQGLTEFLPVSSSGHLIFFPRLFGWADQGIAFDAVIHLGTLLAVLFYFRKDLPAMVRGDRRLAGFILLSAVPAAIVGFLFGDMAETVFRSPAIVAWNLIGWGLVLGIADRYQLVRCQLSDVSCVRRVHDIRWVHAISIGMAQALALIPGTSRSGITMTAGLFFGVNKQVAARFSFLMSMSIIALAGGKKFFDLAQGGFASVVPLPLFIGFLASAVSGFFAIRLLLLVIERWNFLPFAAYRVVVGTLILAYLV